MNWREPQEEETGGPFRILFSEDETREFYRPVVELPTRRIAFWSIGASILLAFALIFSARPGTNRLLKHPRSVSHSDEKLPVHPASQKTIGKTHSHPTGR
ncbi:hypothetical protein ACFQ4C_06460 [Larkinella insperata]|uniref:Uncharacterized protein n=1 Tax=Larkinella insperata TaxID=332158 RepID=A0ABW3QBW5_9BACT|nr:hypothetical protein [Larkinella insperata]